MPEKLEAPRCGNCRFYIKQQINADLVAAYECRRVPPTATCIPQGGGIIVITKWGNPPEHECCAMHAFEPAANDGDNGAKPS